MSAKTITIFSNKGGVGKTFICVNIATALALAGKQVLILDLDFQAGQDMARMLNVSPRYSMADIVPLIDSNKNSEMIKRYAAMHSSGLHFIPGVKATKQIGHITPETIKEFVAVLQGQYDFIIVDGGKSFSETLVAMLDLSNLIFLVATPDILAVYQIKWCLEVLQSLQFPLPMVKLILNRSESRGSVAWQEVRSALTCEIFSHVPSDGRTVGMALNRGIPCVMDDPKAKVSEAFIKIAAGLQREGLYIKTKEIERVRGTMGLAQPDQFWQKFGISHTTLQTQAEASVQEDEIITLKKRVHEKLVERLNLEGITPEAMSDAQSARRIKKSAEEVVSNLVLEEAGGKFASHEERVVLVRDIVNEALGLGPLEDFLADADVTDIMVNNANEIYVEKSGKLILTNKQFVSEDRLRSIIERIISPLGRRIDESTPMVDARLPDGSRINAIIPPLSLRGQMLTIRKFGTERIDAKELIHKHKSFTDNISKFLEACVIGRRNIIVSGGTGAGKTTLLNVISEFIPDSERIITIEDAAELKLRKSHWARLESRPSNIEGRGQVTMRDLFINSLRMRPDRIVIGECRGPEALDMLQAMNTGHDGSMTTLHANSTRDVLTRMHSMILLSGIELPVRAINEMVASAIDIIIHVNRFSDGSRKLTGVSEIAGLDSDFQLIIKDIFVFKQTGVDENGKVLGEFAATGYVPECYDELARRGLAIDKAMFNK